MKPESTPTIPHMLHQTFQAHSASEALLIKRAGMYLGLTYWQLWETTRRLAHGMAEQGFGPGDRIAIISENRPEWVYIDFAGFFLKTVVVPISPSIAPEQMIEQINAAGCRAVFCGNMATYHSLLQKSDQMSSVDFFFPFDTVSSENEKAIFFRQLTAQGEKHRKVHPDFYMKSLEALQSDVAATRLFQEAGNGKAAFSDFTQAQLIETVGARNFSLTSEDVFLSTMPLSNFFERVNGNWLAIANGCKIAYSRGADHLFDDLAEVQPTVLVNSAEFFEKLISDAKQRPARKKGFFGGGKPTLKKALGGKLRLVICEGELSADIRQALQNIGVEIKH